MNSVTQGIFITGTNTNVGKTFIGVNIAKQLTSRNINVIPRKPIESGCLMTNGELVPQDAMALKAAANYQGALSDICPYRFEPPISPARAAHLVNKALSTQELSRICLQHSEDGFLLVEGAGGFYSPLSEDGLNADFAVSLQLPVLLVAEDTLGAINQVLLSVEAIQARGLQLIAVILNTVHDTQHEDMNNSEDLRERLACPVFTTAYDPQASTPLSDEFIESLISASNSTAAAVSASR